MKPKRLLAFILAMCLFFGAAPSAARAENAPMTTAGTGDISFEGTNGFGTLLSDEIAQYQSEMNAQGGYTVTGLEITGNQATVTYDSMEEAQLVVALYTEDGIQLLNSATVTVSPDETEAIVEFAGEMPQYFMASAYLLDSYDYSPLCASYDTPMYTREMQELLASTVDDYDPDRVLNLDDDKTNNFAVYADSTAIIDSVPGVNTLKSADDASRTYIIENADEQITGLQPGDVLAYPYAEGELLILKVGSIRVDGTTVTLIGTDLEMEEVFSHVKLQTLTDSKDVVVTDLDPDDGIAYQGSEPLSQAAPLAWEGESELDISHRFGLDKTFTGDKLDTEVNVKGGLEFVLDGKFQYYVSLTRQFLQLELEVEFGISVNVDGQISTKFDSFAEFRIGPIKGVTIICKPAFEIGFEGEFQYEVMVNTIFGVAFDSETGLRNLCTTPKVETELDLEGTFFIGVDLNPTVDIISKYVAQAELSMPVGLNVNAELTGTDYDEVLLVSADQGPTQHFCRKCLDITVSVQATLDVKLTFLQWDKLSKEDSFEIKSVFWPFYRSFTHNEFGQGDCPHTQYRVVVTVSRQAVPVSDIAVQAVRLEDGSEVLFDTTDSRGTAIHYLHPGKYRFTAQVSGEVYTCDYTVSGSCKIVLSPEASGGQDDYIADSGNSFPIIEGKPKASGSCGRNLTWSFYANGLLLISGTGPMYDYTWADYPWRSHRGSIIRVVVMDGVTTIGKSAFWACGDMTSVYIGRDVKSIGEGAFGYCDELTQVALPDSVTHIGSRAFLYCDRLTGMTIPDGVTYIGEEAFGYCDRMTYVNIPESLTTIGVETFQFCFNLTSVTIPDSVTTISDWAFYQCLKLSEITVGSGVSTIGEGAFEFCDSLKNVYYVGNEAQWQKISIGKRNEALKKSAIHYNSTGPAAANLRNPILSSIWRPERPVDGMNPEAVFGGEYGAETSGGYTVKTASFHGLVPGGQYVLLALADMDAANLLAPANILYIDQAAAGEEGTLFFRYAQRIHKDISYVIACGPSNKNLADAEITFPDMTADGTLQVVSPTVTYDGRILTEGVDYVLTGTVDFTRPGTYTCCIRGIYNYTGLVECQYTVNQPKPVRLAGSHRWNTAIKVADEMKSNLAVVKFDAIIIASGNDFADALAGSYLSTVKNAPILLSWGQGGAFEFLDTDNIEYIKNNLAEDGIVYILGGEKVVPTLYETELADYNVKRLGGADRFETNLLILEEAGVKDGDEILVCTATNFADSLSASATGKPILLVFNNLTELIGKQPEFLAKLQDCTFTVIGGKNAVSDKLAEAIGEYGKVERLAGTNRFETSVMVAQKYFENPETAVLAYAWNYPDGLCGGSLAFSLKAPLILTMTGYEEAAVEYAKTTGIKTGLVLGGDSLISDASVRAIFAMDGDAEIVVK